MGKAPPTRLDQIGRFTLLPSVSRSVAQGTRKQHATGSQIQVCAYPPPPFCFRFGAPLSWVPVLAA